MQPSGPLRLVLLTASEADEPLLRFLVDRGHLVGRVAAGGPAPSADGVCVLGSLAAGRSGALRRALAVRRRVAGFGPAVVVAGPGVDPLVSRIAAAGRARVLLVDETGAAAGTSGPRRGLLRRWGLSGVACAIVADDRLALAVAVSGVAPFRVLSASTGGSAGPDDVLRRVEALLHIVAAERTP